MPDPRSVMKEYRYLDEKRVAEGLTPEEDARYARLRDLVAPDPAAATAAKPGFDVGAATARLRESLMPAGLRTRPPPVPDPAAELPPDAGDAAGLAPGDGEQALAASTSDPAAGWDPAAQPYDPSAGYDAAAYDPAAQAFDPNAQPFDPAAPGYDPNATYDAGGPPAWDPNQPWDGDANPEAGVSPPAYDPAAAADAPSFDGAPALEGDAATLPPEGWDAVPPSPEPPADGVPLGDYDGDAAAFAPLDLAAVDGLPFDAPAEADAPGVPGGCAAPLGEYDDVAGFGARPYAATDLPADAAGLDFGDPAAPPDGVCQPEGAPQPFELASDGSFGEGEPAPAWGAGAAAPWEHAAPADVAGSEEMPACDAGYELSGLPPDGPAGLDFSRPDFSIEETDPGDLVAEVALADALVPEAPDAAASAAYAPVPDDAPPRAEAPAEPEVVLDFEVQAEEESTSAEGAELLVEIAEQSPAPPPRSLDFEPLVTPPAPAPAPPTAGPAAVAAPPAGAAAPAPAPAAAASRSFLVAGAHRVVVHTVEGQVKRGALEDADLGAAALALSLQPGEPGEPIATDKVKAIFFMLAPGETPPTPDGKKVRVTFRDGRQIAGFSPDYDETRIGFFMIPGDARTNTGRIWVYRAAVRQVAVS